MRMLRGSTVSSVLMLLLPLCASSASAQGQLDLAELEIDCSSYSLQVAGAVSPPVDGESVVEYRIELVPSGHTGGDTIVIMGSIPVDGNPEFDETVVGDLEEGLAGWYDVRGLARLVDANTIPIDVIEPPSGKLDCCPGRIGDFVWEDLDADGLQDAGEPGIGGATVNLEGVDIAGGTGTMSTTTDADGFYDFAGLCPGTYDIDVDEATLPANLGPTEPNVGADDTIDSDGPLDGGAVVVRLDSREDLTIDFGYVMDCTGRIGDFVWEDLDGDGVQDAGEPGIAAVRLVLSDGDGNVLAETVTDANGGYGFSELCAGDYQVELDPTTVPSGLAPTLINVDDDDLDSDPNPKPVTLPTDDAEDLTNDFGFALCDECDGGVTGLSLTYGGASAVGVDVEQKDGEVVFSGVVDPGETFTFSGTGDDGKLGSETRIFVDGELAESIHTSCSQPIGPGLVFGDFTVAAATSRNNGAICPLVACAVEGDGSIEISSDKIKWDVTNIGDGPITLDDLTIVWPVANGDLIEIKLEGDKIYDVVSMPPSLTLTADDWTAEADKREIEEGKTATLEIKFDQNVMGPQDEYSISLGFAEGCSIDFVPGAGPFTCEGKISRLTMIWDGTETVDVTAYAGDVGSPIAGEFFDVQVGEEIAVDGFDGAPNDLVWEIFATSGDKLGESKFHRSCSDSEMNGAEDCGTRQGNGKGNEEDLLNDWLLEGLVDEESTLDCTPDQPEAR